ncbi:MAG: hypothetical protein WCK17_18325, partial [Verrucomicrobiota bacterium]
VQGDITVNAGVLVVKDPAALGSGVDMITVNGNSTTGWDGGMLLLDAGTSALVFNQSLSLDGRGATTNNASSALLTLGNVTLNGPVQLGNSSTTSYLSSGYGTLVMAGPVNTTGTSYFSGNGNVVLSGPVSGGGLSKTYGTLPSTLWLQNPNNAFTGQLSISGGYVRVSNGEALGKNATPLSFSGGLLEVRADPDSIVGFANKNVTTGNNSTVQIFLDRGLGGKGLAQTVAFGDWSTSVYSTTVTGRNGYGLSMGKVGSTLGREWQYFTNNSNGLLTVNENVSLNNPTNGGRFDLSLYAVGDIVLVGSISSLAANPAILDGISKYNSGLALFTGTSTSLRGTTSISGGVLQIRGFGALGDVGPQSGAINLSNGALNFAGPAGETTSKLINLSGTTSNGMVLANQSGLSPLVFNSGVAAGGAGSKTLLLGGTNAAANQISGIINQNGGTTSVFKADTGTWVYSPLATLAVGGTGTTVSAGTSSSSALIMGATAGLSPGMSVSGTNVPSGAVITSIIGNTLWLSSAASTAVPAGTLLTFGSLTSFTGNLSISAGTMRLQATSATSDVLSN